MDPLTREDLLAQNNPGDGEGGFQGSPSESHPNSKEIRLERFQTLEHVIREHPINVDPYLELARIYLQRERWVDAKRILDLAVDKFPEDEDANYLREEAQLKRSIQLLKEAQSEHSEGPTRLTQEALDRCNIELNVLKEKVCRSRLARHPTQRALNLTLAVALEHLGKDGEAITCLQGVVSDPDLRARAALHLGKLLEKSRRVPEALAAYRRAALFRIPEAPAEIKLEAITLAANLAENFGLIDSARRYTKLLLEMQPNNSAIQERLTRLENTPL